MNEQPLYLRSCASCSAHIATANPQRANRPTGFLDESSVYCPRCEEKNAAKFSEWGGFKKGDRVKLKHGGHVWYRSETLCVNTVSDDGQDVTVFRLGFGTAETTAIKASELEFSQTWGRS